MPTALLAYDRDELGKLIAKLRKDRDGNCITVALQGPPAVGKTYTLRAIADFYKMSFYSIPCHEDMQQSEMVGGYAPVRGQWDYQKAAVLKAWLDPNPNGCMVTFEDAHQAGGAFASTCYLALDEGRSITVPHGETFEQPKGHVWYGITTNGTTDELDLPIQSRIGFVFTVTRPSSKQLATIDNPYIREACTYDYEAHEAGAPLSADFRRWRSLDRTYDLVGLKVALSGTVGDGTPTLANFTTPGNTTAGILASLAAAGMPEANALLAELAGTMPSGAPTNA